MQHYQNPPQWATATAERLKSGLTTAGGWSDYRPAQARREIADHTGAAHGIDEACRGLICGVQNIFANGEVAREKILAGDIRAAGILQRQRAGVVEFNLQREHDCPQQAGSGDG
jgi:hypothetical protein